MAGWRAAKCLHKSRAGASFLLSPLVRSHSLFVATQEVGQSESILPSRRHRLLTHGYSTGDHILDQRFSKIEPTNRPSQTRGRRQPVGSSNASHYSTGNGTSAISYTGPAAVSHRRCHAGQSRSKYSRASCLPLTPLASPVRARSQEAFTPSLPRATSPHYQWPPKTSRRLLNHSRQQLTARPAFDPRTSP